MVAYLYDLRELVWFMNEAAGSVGTLERVFGKLPEDIDEDAVKGTLTVKGFINPGGLDPVQAYLMRQIAGAGEFRTADGGKINVLGCEEIAVIFRPDARGKKIKLIPCKSTELAREALREDEIELDERME